MNEQSKDCMNVMNVHTRVTILETDMKNLKDQMIRTERQLGLEIKDLKEALGNIRTQISGLQVRLAVIVAISAGGVTALAKLLPLAGL